MKTAQQRDEEHRQILKQAKKAKQFEQASMVEYIDTLGSQCNVISERQTYAKRARNAVRDGNGELIDTACDECGAAIVDMMPGYAMTGAYLFFEAICPGCGAFSRLRMHCREKWRGGDNR